jgi:diphthamide synthase (EF-2-diphthine--ammonia ligase)
MFKDPGFKATIIGVNTKYLSNEWLGFTISNETAREFRSKTPQIDPLGENGEFHTIVVESPLYSNRFKIEVIEKITEKEMTSLRVTLAELNS